jgi:hypothetical protein
MTPKEKADELIREFTIDLEPFSEHGKWDENQGKECALIHVNYILKNMILYKEKFDAGLKIHHQYYWKEVKQEIEKL